MKLTHEASPLLSFLRSAVRSTTAWALASVLPGPAFALAQNTNVSSTNPQGLSLDEAECSTDVNPTNPCNRVIIGHPPKSLGTVQYQYMSSFYTLDAGESWSFVAVGDAEDGLTCAVSRYDPSIAFDANGKLYVSYGVTCPDPLGGPDDHVLVVLESTDGGASYGTSYYVDARPALGPTPGIDKPHLATGPDPGNPGQENVYVAYTQVEAEPGGTDVRIAVSGLYGGAGAFSSPVIVNDGSQGGTTSSGKIFADPAVGPDGRVYVAWYETVNGAVWIDDSLNAAKPLAKFGADNLITTISPAFDAPCSKGRGLNVPIAAAPSRGVHAGPTIDTDRSGGQLHGRVYVTYVDVGGWGFQGGCCPPCTGCSSALQDLDVFVQYSDTAGASWSGRVRVNDDTGYGSQFLPWLDVDRATGSVGVVWYDTRNDPLNEEAEVFLAFNEDGLATYSNMVVSDAPSDQSRECGGSSSGRNYLEYIGLALVDCIAYPAWADNSSVLGNTDFFTDEVPLGCPAVGPNGVTCGVDLTIPQISCPPDVSVGCTDPTDPGATGLATATDNCDPCPVISYFDILAPGNCPPSTVISNISRTWTATDVSGNVNFCVQSISVVDFDPPVITPPPPLVVDCNRPGGVGSNDPAIQAWVAQATAVDECGDATLSYNLPAVFPAGCGPGAETSVIFTAIDECGNSDFALSSVTVTACDNVVYCTPGTSASGCTALISSTGSASLSAPSGFIVSVTTVEGQKNGLLYFNTLGPQASPWGNGTSFQCVAPPVQRTLAQASGGSAGACDGTFQIDFNAWMATNPVKAPTANETAYMQAWYRDPSNTSNQSTSLSDALSFTVCP